ncbi:MAG: ideR [Phycisphaerales bacterium]|nr:ideR [Phycisphaerales bacterium]
MPSITVENYVKQIYLAGQQQQPTGGQVSMGRLAAAVGVVPGTVTTMVKALVADGLVDYEPRGGVTLTRDGERLALHVLRRHRLVELLLVRVLGLDWSEVHAEAEVLEHAVSDKVLERIDALLGSPTVDPHGDPIPSAKGKVDGTRRHSLAECTVGRPLRVARVTDQDPAFLQFIDRCGLVPGAAVTVEGRDASADAVLVRPDGRRAVTLGGAAAEKVLVEG